MENKRIWEIDYLRTIAIILMIAFHVVYDLNEFLGVKINYWSGFWYWEGQISALLFIFLAGISSGFSKKNIKRGFGILGVAFLISLVTYVLYDELFIRYGILHLLGTAMILFPLFKKMNVWFLLIISIGILSSTFFIENVTLQNPLLLPLGIEYTGFRSLDYYPLIPYVSVFILGIVAYKSYYYKRKSLFIYDFSNKIITTISKNSLLIYIFHQPFVIFLIYFVEFIIKGKITPL